MKPRSNPTPTELELAEIKTAIAELVRRVAGIEQALGVREGFERREKAVV